MPQQISRTSQLRPSVGKIKINKYFLKKLFYKAWSSKQNDFGIKNTYRPMDQNREPRNKPMDMWSINLQQRSQKYAKEKQQSLQ